ncbi:Uncharacterised protein [Starkeya nomas]|uniref:Uncharacterized protein n=1 Tax=Starkeya nomas TaxID=2666134 RepID=A0A5S9NWK6_9HYPH|nr:hypothetical protein [Starkeya nomas]CAA0095112.1 Uncharacterised protein [Starkeya nomas]
MDNVVPLHPYAELRGGVITESSDPSRSGKAWYFVDYVDEGGRCFGVWDGPSYDAACEALSEWGSDGVRTIDLLRKAL